MKAANKSFLDEQRFHYEKMIASGVLRSLDYYTRHEMARVMSEEFMPGYRTPDDCGPCIFDMVKMIYERYDAWLAAQPVEPPQLNAQIKTFATFPKHYKSKTK